VTHSGFGPAGAAGREGAGPVRSRWRRHQLPAGPVGLRARGAVLARSSWCRVYR